MDDIIIREIIKQAAIGNRDSFEKLYEITKKYVYKTVYFLLEDKSEVDDAVQEIYINLFKGLKNFDTTKPFRPWLTGIMMKKIGDVRRRKWKLTRVLTKILTSVRPQATDSLKEVEINLMYGQLQNSIERLSPKLKDVILLRYVHDFSQDEVAKILQIPVGTVKSRINSALIKLRADQLTAVNLKEGKPDVI